VPAGSGPARQAPHTVNVARSAGVSRDGTVLQQVSVQTDVDAAQIGPDVRSPSGRAAHELTERSAEATVVSPLGGTGRSNSTDLVTVNEDGDSITSTTDGAGSSALARSIAKFDEWGLTTIDPCRPVQIGWGSHVFPVVRQHLCGTSRTPPLETIT
jgi:hypothetical protein